MAVAAGLSFSGSGSAEPGHIHVENHRLFAACAEETWIELIEIQLEGRKRLPAAEFLRGTVLAKDARLG
jgi:methionyl-tRNA formyltransferase